jgi:hypothetical protein
MYFSSCRGLLVVHVLPIMQGVAQIVVVVNKMDCTSPTPWLQERYAEIETAMRALLCTEMGYPEKLVRFVPLSGLTGENILFVNDACPLREWYRGPTLQEMIDSFLVPPRSSQKPLRAVVREVTCSDVAHGRCEAEVVVLQGKLAHDRNVGFYSVSSASQPAKEAALTESSGLKGGGHTDTDELRLGGEVAVAHAAKHTVVKCTIVSSSAGFPSSASEQSGSSQRAMLLTGERGTVSLTNK